MVRALPILLLLLVGACTPGPAMRALAPLPPAALSHWLTGRAEDATVRDPVGGLLLMGGGADVDAAFAWQRDRITGGDVVVLRASGADGYNDYLFTDLGGVDSVETLLIDGVALASDPYVVWQIDHAEAIFLAGGDQAVYLASWQGTPLAAALQRAWTRRAVLGGTSAGAAVLGAIVYSAENGSVYSDEALADPFDARVTLAPPLVTLPPLAAVITDTHFSARDRMGRLLAFVAVAIATGRATAPLGLGLDEATALVVDAAGHGTVLGDGAVYALQPSAPPERCAAGQPLTWSEVALRALRAGDTITLPGGTSAVAAGALGASDGSLVPSDPY